eukprot:2126317-Rhodomonas_salina.2
MPGADVACGAASVAHSGHDAQHRSGITPSITSGMSLAVFYTAPPFRLKYYALGGVFRSTFATASPVLTHSTPLRAIDSELK